MNIFGIRFGRKSKATLPATVNTLNSASSRGGWVSIVRESFSGAWQRNVTVDKNTVLSHYAYFACITLIASDISKLRVKLMQVDLTGIWQETTNGAYSPVLRKPNGYQTRNQFWESWILSKLIHGNAYILKQRDGRGVVVRLYVLDPTLVKPLVSDDGSVFYELHADNITGLTGTVIVPAREIIHDRFNCLFHPLVGVPPVFANGLAAMQGLNIQNFSARFFENDAQPGGILSAVANIDDAQAKQIREAFAEKYGGANRGKVAVLGNGMKFEAMSMKMVDSQMIEQLKLSAEIVCSCFHVPPHKVQAAPVPTNNNVQALNIEYYSQCIQKLVEDAESCLDDGLGMDGVTIGTEFDIDSLLRMDTATQLASLKDAVGAGIMAPNEARKRLDLSPIAGGEMPYLQEQNWPLTHLSQREVPTREPTKPVKSAAVRQHVAAEIEKAIAALPPIPEPERLFELIDKQVRAIIAEGQVPNDAQ